ncbi:hypothetical protein [Paraferrimonas sp. SM1919]|uniref:hypothetical protein n=1 Tax=Paraferrimonas sp. SM1919 TaxID=2662263 RepID=UPI0013D19E52|nr:hypothetical protein [Paraferrimonas sp. SM1919]
MNKLLPIVCLSLLLILSPAYASKAQSTCQKNWIEKSDQQFAADCADMAFDGSLKDRQKVAWMLFARINQLIDDRQGVSGSNKVPQWMAWATDADTFTANPTFKYTQVNRADMQPVTDKKLLAGGVSLSEPDGANEEVTRNYISYDYLTQTAKLNTKEGFLAYVNAGNKVDMPIGTIELKASWLKVPDMGAPKGAITFNFASGEYWFRGIHIMVKMRKLTDVNNLFYSEDPSWFWTTFEFTNNPGVSHVRDEFITQNAPLTERDINKILKQAGVANVGFEAYTPNGTQIRFTEDADGKTPVILGHTDMEDFAGSPNTAQPSYWTSFNSSCHSCHATAAINPKTGEFFPFSVPKGKLTPQYYGTTTGDSPKNLYLGDGFVPLDFMWPIPFQAKAQTKGK